MFLKGSHVVLLYFKMRVLKHTMLYNLFYFFEIMIGIEFDLSGSYTHTDVSVPSEDLSR